MRTILKWLLILSAALAAILVVIGALGAGQAQDDHTCTPTAQPQAAILELAAWKANDIPQAMSEWAPNRAQADDGGQLAAEEMAKSGLGISDITYLHSCLEASGDVVSGYTLTFIRADGSAHAATWYIVTAKDSGKIINMTAAP